jgi:hypothetical protein
MMVLLAGEKNQRPKDKNPGIAAGVLHSLSMP